MTGIARTSLILGITGGLACGKSEVGRILGQFGFAICDADLIAHALMKRGTPVYLDVVGYFGDQILSEDKEIARSVLGQLVFKNPTGRLALNQMVHPAVQSSLECWISEMWRQKKKAAALVPLLFESGMDALDWDEIICVTSDESVVMQRLKDRGLQPDDAARRVGSQMPLAEKKDQANYVVLNNGTLDDLEQATREMVDLIIEEREL